MENRFGKLLCHGQQQDAKWFGTRYWALRTPGSLKTGSDLTPVLNESCGSVTVVRTRKKRNCPGQQATSKSQEREGRLSRRPRFGDSSDASTNGTKKDYARAKKKCSKATDCVRVTPRCLELSLKIPKDLDSRNSSSNVIGALRQEVHDKLKVSQVGE